MNFHRNTNSDKRSTRVNHQAKAPSAESNQAIGSSRGLFRRALATRGASRGSEGSGAPSLRRAPIVLFALIAGLAAAPAPASASSAEMGTISDVSYTTATVKGKVTLAGPIVNEFQFQYCTTGCTEPSAIWKTGYSGSFLFPATDKEVEGTISVPKGGTKYFVRLEANSPFGDTPSVSPAPYPDFTTLAVDPPPTIVATDDASGIFSTSAKASGKVKRPAGENPALDVTACRFEYVTDADFTATDFTGAVQVPCAEVSPEAPLTEPNEERAVSAQLSGLNPATTYHLRLAAENAAPAAATKEAANTFTTHLKVAKPVVIAADDATDVGKRTAKVTGEIERPAGADPALDTSCRFEYVTDEQFIATGFDDATKTDCVEAPPGAPLTNSAPSYPAVSADVSAELTGLTPDITYHLRLTAENGAGTVTKVAASTFTTLPLISPSVTVDSITEVGYQKARVNATADPGNQGVQYEVEYALAETDEWFNLLGPGGRGGLGPGAPPLLFSKVLGPLGYRDAGPNGGFYDVQPGPGLKPGTTYKVRGGWKDGEEFAYHHSPEPYPDFTTKGTSTAPSASCDPVTIFTGTTAHFTCTVDPKAPDGPLDDEGKAAYKTDWQFECTPECKDPNGNPIAGGVEAEGGAQPIAVDAKRLDPNTQYEVKLVIHSATGTVETPVQAFHTPLIKPTVKVALGGSDGKGGYTLQGIVNPNNSSVTDCKFEWGPNSSHLDFNAPCSPPPGDKAQPVTVEAHLTGLNPGVVYHYNLLATNDAGTSESGDQEFIPTLDKTQSCLNEQLRTENNSLALPECRAYEKVTPDGKEGFAARLEEFNGDDGVRYSSGAGNIARSGQNRASNNAYGAIRSTAGWETIPNLNGASGTLKDAPSFVTTPGAVPFAYSADLHSSLWRMSRLGGSPGLNYYLRSPDGTFTFVGSPDGAAESQRFTSADLSHLVLWTNAAGGPLDWGPGVYEFVGSGNDQPRRVDVDNPASPITTCALALQGASASAFGRSISSDGRVVTFMVIGGCGGANPPTNEIWARVNGTTSIDVSASQCSRTAADPGGLCNGPVGSGDCITVPGGGFGGDESGPGCRGVRFEGAAEDGSRVFISTNQQLLDADVDQSRDIYACDIPSGNPAPSAEKANHCTALMQISGAQISGAQTGAAVEDVVATSDNGATVVFTAKGVLTDNEDALREEAVAGDHNLYVWRTDAVHPDGQITFVGRSYADKCPGGDMNNPVLVDCPPSIQTTPDGRHLVLNTASQLLDTDTDTARDVYRYDVDTGQLTRVSTNVFGTAGNGDFDARLPVDSAVSDDGKKIAFTTTEALSPADGNGEPDVYLWTPDRVSLISTGAVGAGGESPGVTASGQSIYFNSAGALTPADGDDIVDVYSARVGGGFSFAQVAPCSGAGGACQAHAPSPGPAPAPTTTQPLIEPGNVKPKVCLKGKVVKGDKCVKKKKKHSGKKHHGKKAHHKRGGGK